MNKIILTGKETKQQLQDIMVKRGIKYSKIDTKIKLWDHIDQYNDNLIGKNTSVIEIEEEIEEEIQDNKKYDVNEIGSIFKLNNRRRFFIEKKYGDLFLSKNKWEKIFRSEKLV